MPFWYVHYVHVHVYKIYKFKPNIFYLLIYIIIKRFYCILINQWQKIVICVLIIWLALCTVKMKKILHRDFGYQHSQDEATFTSCDCPLHGTQYRLIHIELKTIQLFPILESPFNVRQAWSVTMVEYWPHYISFCVFVDFDFVYVHKHAKTYLANVQSS